MSLCHGVHSPFSCLLSVYRQTTSFTLSHKIYFKNRHSNHVNKRNKKCLEITEKVVQYRTNMVNFKEIMTSIFLFIFEIN